MPATSAPTAPLAPLAAIVVDLAGTIVDFGCLGPLRPFAATFANAGITVTFDEVRGPMGLGKRDHLAALLALPRVRDAWQAYYGRLPNEADLDRLYHDFAPRQLAAIDSSVEPIGDIAGLFAGWRQQGRRLALTTGYDRATAERVVARLGRAGVVADAMTCVDDVVAGRPAPWMNLRALERMQVWPARRALAIGDTAADMAAARAAGMWAIGVVRSGNQLGMTEAELAAADPTLVAERCAAGAATLTAAGAHWAIDDIHRIAPLIAELDQRIAAGAQP